MSEGHSNNYECKRKTGMRSPIFWVILAVLALSGGAIGYAIGIEASRSSVEASQAVMESQVDDIRAAYYEAGAQREKQYQKCVAAAQDAANTAQGAASAAQGAAETVQGAAAKVEEAAESLKSGSQP